MSVASISPITRRLRRRRFWRRLRHYSVPVAEVIGLGFAGGVIAGSTWFHVVDLIVP